MSAAATTASRRGARRTPSVLAAALLLALLGGLVLVAPPATAERYTPGAGVTFNKPLSPKVAARRRIIDKVLRSVGAAPKGSIIRFASWNIRGPAVVDALLAAHERGVIVRVVMDRKNAYPGNPNRAADQIKVGLKHYKRKRPEGLRSGLRKCHASCRGQNGFAHSKFFLFSQSGKAHDVVINTSANATDLAASNQWNDAYTTVGDTATYDAFVAEFDQMYRDEPVEQPYVTSTSGAITSEFFPDRGAGTDEDPIVATLRQVTCTGATNTADGRTDIHISMTSWFGARGLDIVDRVVALKRQGCRVEILYAVAGGDVRRAWRRAGIRSRHIVSDFNRDGVYDRYLHQKVLTIRGGYGADTGAWFTQQGSANWSPLALLSDEANLQIMSQDVLLTYNHYLDDLFRHPPRRFGGPGTPLPPDKDRLAVPQRTGVPGAVEGAARRGAADDPMRHPAYAQVQVD